MVFTTFAQDTFSADDVLHWYRLRWQVELMFKRLKSLAQLGHLPKADDESARAWLYGKLFVALLSEQLIRRGQTLSPWRQTDSPSLPANALAGVCFCPTPDPARYRTRAHPAGRACLVAQHYPSFNRAPTPAQTADVRVHFLLKLALMGRGGVKGEQISHISIDVQCGCFVGQLLLAFLFGDVLRHPSIIRYHQQIFLQE